MKMMPATPGPRLDSDKPILAEPSTPPNRPLMDLDDTGIDSDDASKDPFAAPKPGTKVYKGKQLSETNARPTSYV